MDLKLVQKHWDRFGRKDPLWAALTVPGKEGRRWSVDDFLATGRAEIAAVLRTADERGLIIHRGHALDFGCGVGRLTQALAATFETVDGVDIAPSMIERARQLNRHPQTCSYHLSAAPDLGLFSEGFFDFVYSTLVLQHMDPETAKRYIGEFCRLLAPGGVAVFQVPSDHAADDPPMGAPRTVGTTAIAPADRKARLRCDDPLDPVGAGKALILRVTVTNDSSVPWPAQGGFDSGYAVTLGGRWLDAAQRPLRKGNARCPLPADLLPGQTTSLLLGIEAPSTNGEHVLELDVVQEHVAWFSDSGSPPRRLRFVVEGGVPAASRSSVLFHRRYPRVQRALRAAGSGAVRVWLNRCVVMSRRRARYLRDLWRRRTATTPIMEMNCVPRSEVEAVVSAARRRVVGIDTHVIEGGFRSRVYWVVRPAGEPGA